MAVVPSMCIVGLAVQVDEVVDMIENTLGPLADGEFDPSLVCFRPSIDPLPMAHHPLAFYVLTHIVANVIQPVALRYLGFKQHTVPCKDGHVLTYWHRDISGEFNTTPQGLLPVNADVEGATPTADNLPSNDALSSAAPTVFFHGVGGGIVMYLSFVKQLTEGLVAANWATQRGPSAARECRQTPLAPSSAIYLVEQPHITMQLDEDAVLRQIPARFFADGVTRMLRVHGHGPRCTKCAGSLDDAVEVDGTDKWNTGQPPVGVAQSGAVFIGHSFGTLPVAWMIRWHPEWVHRATLVDPICLLMYWANVATNFVYRIDENQPGYSALASYLLNREPHLAHSLTRNFWWFENTLWAEDLHGLAEVPCCDDASSPPETPVLLVLSEHDYIVPTRGVLHYLNHWFTLYGEVPASHSHDEKSPSATPADPLPHELFESGVPASSSAADDHNRPGKIVLFHNKFLKAMLLKRMDHGWCLHGDHFVPEILQHTFPYASRSDGSTKK